MILAIDSSGSGNSRCSVSLFEQSGRQLETRLSADAAEGVLELVDSALDGRPKSDLTSIAANQGPGSFTGIRIGLAIASGLSTALSVPLIYVPLLNAFAFYKLVRSASNSGDSIPLTSFAVRANPREFFVQDFSWANQNLQKQGELRCDPAESVRPPQYEILEDRTVRSELIGEYVATLGPELLLSSQRCEPFYGKPLNALTLKERGVSVTG